MVNKKAVLIVTVIAIIVVSIIVGWKVYSLQSNENYTSEILSDVEDEEENTTIETSEEENSLPDEEVETSSEETDETVTNTDDTSDDQSSEENSGEDQALQLAKQEWGEDDTDVYYYLEEQLSENVYIISVRNKDTTATQIDYEVNIETGEVSEY